MSIAKNPRAHARGSPINCVACLIHQPTRVSVRLPRASRWRQPTGSVRFDNQCQTRRTRVLTHAARRLIPWQDLFVSRHALARVLKASRWRQPAGSVRFANQYQSQRTRVLTHAARRLIAWQDLFISRYAYARRAAGVSQRVPSVSLTNVKHKEPACSRTRLAGTLADYFNAFLAIVTDHCARLCR